MAIILHHRTTELLLYGMGIFEVQVTSVVQMKGIHLRQTSTGS
jgi:hypothetical protein